MSERSIVFNTDSYKPSHYLQFPPDAQRSFYYIESRSDGEEIVVFGPQMLIKKILRTVPTHEDVTLAAAFWPAHGEPFNEEGWRKIVNMGFFPLRIRAVAEGTTVPTKRLIMSIENTIDGYEWLPGWVETRFMHIWYPITVATNSQKARKIIKAALEKSGDVNGLAFKLHDFGYRGCTCQEQAEIGGMSHLVTGAMGTDTAVGILCARDYYPDPKNPLAMYAYSIPAAEHSTMGSWGRENEVAACKNMLDKFGDGMLVAVVSDTYDLENAVENIWGKTLKQQVLDMNAVLVVRPDSGDPVTQVINTLVGLEKNYGSVKNDKRYKVLNKVRVIQGDGIDNAVTIGKILEEVMRAGYSADNVAFGMGAGLLQKCNRDTFKFAQKCSAILRSGEWQEVYKCPVDAPWKASKKGRFTLTNDFVEVQLEDNENTCKNDLMRTIYEDGELLIEESFETIRSRCMENV